MGRVISISIVATDNLSRAFERAAKSTEKLQKGLDGLEKVGKGVALATLAAGAVALGKAAAPAAAAVAALPVAMLAAQAATLTLKVGIKGMGDAMKAAAGGDAKKLDAALKNLAPSARGVAKEMIGLQKAFKPVQKAVQQELFSGLAKPLHQLGKGGLPVVREGMLKVADAMNGVAKTALKSANTPWFKGAVARVFTAAANSINTMRGAVKPLMQVLAQLIQTGAPLFERMVGWAAAGIKAGAAFATSARGAGMMTRIVAQAGDTLAQLGRILGNLVTGLVNIVRGADAFNSSGGDMLTLVEGLTAKFAAWSGSAKGQQQVNETFKTFGEIAREIVHVLPLVLGPLGAIAKVLTSVHGPMRGVVIQTIAWATVLGLLANRLKLVWIMTNLFKGGALLTQFALGFMSVARGSADGASAAARFGSSLRLQLGIMRAYAVAQLRAAKATVMATLATVRHRAAMIATATATKLAAAASALWTAVTSANPIVLVIAALIALGIALVVAYKKVGWFRDFVNAAWKAISAIAMWAWNHALKYVFDAIKLYIGIQVAYFKFWWSVVKLAWEGVSTAVKVAWGLIKPIWRGIQLYVQLLKLEFKLFMIAAKLYWNLIWNVIKTAWAGIKVIWNAIKTFIIGPLLRSFKDFYAGAKLVWNNLKSTLQTVWNTGIRPVFDKLKDGLSKIKTAFKTAVDYIGRVWNGLRNATKTPVNFVIGIYNNGIRPLVQGIAKLIGKDSGLPHIDTFAKGGVLPGYSPGRDNMLIGASGGEAMMRPEWARAMGSDYINSGNRAARKGGVSGVRRWMGQMGGEGIGFADGGVVPFGGNYDLGGIVGGFIKGVKDFAFKNVERAAKSMLGKVLGQHVPGSGMIQQLMAGIPAWIKDRIWGWLKDKISGGGPGMQNALRWAQAQAGKPYVWGGVGPGGYDCSGFMSAITNVIRGKSPYSRLFTTFSFSPGGGPSGFIPDQRSGFMLGITNAGVGHMAGTLLGKNVESSGSAGVRVGGGARGYNDGLFGMQFGMKADTGGILRKGWNPPIYNGTGKPEFILTTSQLRGMIPPSSPKAMRHRNARTFPWLDLGQGRAIGSGGAKTFPLIGKRAPGPPGVKFPLIGKQIPDAHPGTGGGGGGGTGSGNSYQINVYMAPGTDPRAVGATIVKYIQAYEARNGRGWRTP